jgi:hypothetical protein
LTSYFKKSEGGRGPKSEEGTYAAKTRATHAQIEAGSLIDVRKTNPEAQLQKVVTCDDATDLKGPNETLEGG